MRNKKEKKDIVLAAGFSLVELIIVMGILGGVVAVVTAFQAEVFKLNRIFGGGIDASFEANRLVKDFTRTVRPLTRSEQGAFPVEIAATSSFAFFSDIDSDGVVERVRYYLSSTTLMKGIVEPTGVPLSYVLANEISTSLIKGVRNAATSSIFYYYDRNYAGTSSPMTFPVTVSGVRHVRMTLIIDADPWNPPAPVTVTTGVTFRNLKDNQ